MSDLDNLNAAANVGTALGAASIIVIAVGFVQVLLLIWAVTMLVQKWAGLSGTSKVLYIALIWFFPAVALICLYLNVGVDLSKPPTTQ